MLKFAAVLAAMVILMAGPASGKSKRADGGAAAKLHALYDADWQDTLARDPISGSRHGVAAARDKMPSAAPADLIADARRDEARLAALARIDRRKLSSADQVDAGLFDWMLTDRVAQAKFRAWRMPMTNDSGFQTEVLFMHEGQPFKTVDDYEAYIRRLTAAETYIDQNIANMREGLKDGFTLPSEILSGVEDNIRAQQFKTGEDCPLYEPFKKFAPTIPAASHEALRRGGQQVIEAHVIPALGRLKTFMETEYHPGARTTRGAAQMPDGAAYYQAQIRSYTTTGLTAAQIHKIGLDEVARIRGEMDAIIAKIGFQGDFAAFLNHLRTDKKYYPQSADELLMRASLIAKRIDGKLPEYFGMLPRTPYGVIPVPAEIAPNYTAGRYNQPSPDGRRAGFYWVNIYKPEGRPLYNLTALTLHEAVPGHHLQIALALEQGDVPEFRKQLYLTAFGEGWALYAEKLGLEMGVYETPIDDFGRLTYEMWRACRLVVDTGIHASGWSRQRAIDYLASNTALPMREVITEIDRYISWPGQALGYKLGELKIWELRRRAATALGATFDLRRFHDAVLANGALTLDMLEQQIDTYISREKTTPRGASKS